MEYFIDAKNKLSPEIMKDFLESVKNEDITVLLTHADGSEECFEKQNIAEAFAEKRYKVEDADVIILGTETRALEIFGADFNWWSNSRRVKKLFETNIEVKQPRKKKEPATVEEHIVVVQYEDEKEMFKGSTKQCIQFINKWFAFMYVKSFGKEDAILIKIDDNEPKTMNQLKEEGVLA